MKDFLKNNQLWVWLSFFAVVLVGILVRFYQITRNQFIYYDEGLYLDINRKFLTLVQQNFPKTFTEFLQTFKLLFFFSLATGKAFWIFLSDTRIYFLGLDAWYFPRVLSAIFGAASLGVVYLFAKNYFRSQGAALLSVALLAVFPSHVYYSRLALQESCSTFCYLAAMYFYCFPRRISWKTFVAGILFACVYFTNYRMIIIPGLVAVAEIVMSFSLKEKINFRKYLWAMLIFGIIVVFVGNLYDARNAMVTFSWMFYQSHLAEQKFDILNFFAFPFYLFYLESFLFGVLFFGNVYFIVKKEWGKVLPFALVMAQMIVFSLVQDKAVRYLCTAMPFMNMAAAGLIIYLFKSENRNLRIAILALSFLLVGYHAKKSFDVANFSNAYETSIESLASLDPEAGILTTQPYIQKLYAHDKTHVLDAPKNYRYLLNLYLQGYRYLIVDPQAYISYTFEGIHFERRLVNYLDFIVNNIKPVQIYPHFKRELLKRFVLEHNQNLRTSLVFIRSNRDGQLGQLKVYDIGKCLGIMKAKNSRYEHIFEYLKNGDH